MVFRMVARLLSRVPRPARIHESVIKLIMR
jgi:hypothetical protein